MAEAQAQAQERELEEEVEVVVALGPVLKQLAPGVLLPAPARRKCASEGSQIYS
jgi:hypothetical protein